MPNFDLGDYVDVSERLTWFFEHYPEGSLQADILERGEDYVVIKAVAYRSPTDARPGTGMASEPVPGRTPYTKDSEVMVGETSAWGRALAAIGAPTKGSIASRQEVRNRRSSPAAEPATAGMATKGEISDAVVSAASSPAGGTTSASSTGKAGADMETGGGSAKAAVTHSTGPASPGFPIAPENCDHKMANGHWVKWRDGVCPKCGTPQLIAMESGGPYS
jgi:hypothetical protein